ncbi:MAG: cold-shock protein [Shimia sp.]|nr:cold-shock protein [Shimia sp.]
MPTGTVKWFNSMKGYGFIEPNDGSADAFVHISAVEQAGLSGLREGQKVEYEVVPGRNGKSSAEKSYAGKWVTRPDQAALVLATSLTAMPSANLMPSMSLGN